MRAVCAARDIEQRKQGFFGEFVSGDSLEYMS